MIKKLSHKCKIFVNLWLAIAILIVANATNAQTSNPLATTQIKDPLVPKAYGRRDLTPLEKYRLEGKILELEQAAIAARNQGDLEQAMELWYRQLKLIRILDPSAEIEALGKVGEIAWSENRRQDLRNVAERLAVIQSENSQQNEVDINLATKLAIAYQKMRYLDRSILLYQQILANQRKSASPKKIEETLNVLGELYLGIFDYENALLVYQELGTNSNNLANQENYLLNLSRIYQNTGKIKKAIAVREQLIKQYSANKKSAKIASLTIDNGRDRETLHQTPLAIKTYESALKIALNNQQFALSAQALNNLGTIYQQQKHWQPAIKIYTQLIPIQQQANNYYGLINTYETLSKIYITLNQKPLAQKYLEQALSLAQTLNYRVQPLQKQIEQLSSPTSQ